jgi:hypothetical protein
MEREVQKGGNSMKILTSFAILLLIAAAIGGIILLVCAAVNSYGIFHAKRKWIIAGVVVLLAGILLAGSGLLRGPIDLTKVERIELHTYDHVRQGQVELTQAEQWMIAFLYNISPRGGEITAEPCCSGYTVDVYLANGSKTSISENGASIMNVRVRDERGSDDFCAKCPLLVEYILSLAEKYGLPID